VGFNLQDTGKWKTVLKIPRLPSCVCFEKRRWTNYTKESDEHTYLFSEVAWAENHCLVNEGKCKLEHISKQVIRVTMCTARSVHCTCQN